jgi:hypothetical protein
VRTIVLTEEEVAVAGVDELRAAYRELRAETYALRKLISERTRAAVGDLRELGIKFNGNLPYGLEADAMTKAIRASQHEKQMISEIKRLHGEGLSLRSISRTLAERRFFNRKGKSIDAKQISRILATEAGPTDPKMESV